MTRVIGALVLTYFISRALRWFGLRPPSVAKLAMAHVLSLALLVLLMLALRLPADTFMVSQVWVYVFAQAAWLLLDFYRAQIAFWKPPVSSVTEPSQAARGGRSR